MSLLIYVILKLFIDSEPSLALRKYYLYSCSNLYNWLNSSSIELI